MPTGRKDVLVAENGSASEIHQGDGALQDLEAERTNALCQGIRASKAASAAMERQSCTGSMHQATA